MLKADWLVGRFIFYNSSLSFLFMVASYTGTFILGVYLKMCVIVDIVKGLFFGESFISLFWKETPVSSFVKVRSEA